MENQLPDDLEHQREVLIEVQGTSLVCHRTEAGSWICCAEDGAPHCARGLTVEGAAANWERAQLLDA